MGFKWIHGKEELFLHLYVQSINARTEAKKKSIMTHEQSINSLSQSSGAKQM
jgi:hypothetical protein